MYVDGTTGVAPSSSSIWPWHRCVSAGVTPLPRMRIPGSLGKCTIQVNQTALVNHQYGKSRIIRFFGHHPQANRCYWTFRNPIPCDDDSLDCLLVSCSRSFTGLKPPSRPQRVDNDNRGGSSHVRFMATISPWGFRIHGGIDRDEATGTSEFFVRQDPEV